MARTVPAPAADAVLQIEGLGLAGDPAPLSGLDLTVHEGQTAALLGEDQVLLTRIVRLIGGLERPDRGTIRLLGVDVGSANRRELLTLRRRVGYVSVAGGLLSNMTVRANIEIAMRYHGDCEPGQVAGRAQALLDEGALTDLADEPASVIPAEYQKCAAYVRALASNPDVVLVEDPAAFLHPEGRATIERLHERLQRSRTTVLLADDDIALAERLVTRAIWFQGATITYDGPFAGLPRPGATTGRTEIP
ncbi:MAG: ATP-binding cassette domain-containing protein [Myxococcota bacterium]